MLLGSFLEPVGIGLKFVVLAIALARPSFASIALLVVVYLLIAVGLVVSFVRSSSLSMADLQAYIKSKEGVSWFRSALPQDFGNVGSPDRPWTAPANDTPGSAGNIYLISYSNNVSTDTVCYYNAVGDTYVVSVNAGEDFLNLPLMQRFVILHELGHATWAGGEAWIRAWPNCLYSLLALIIAFYVTDGGSWWSILIGITGAMFFIGQALSAAKITTAEIFADRYSIKLIAAGNMDDALKVAGRLITLWSRAVIEKEDQFRRHLELQSRIKGLRRLIHMIERTKADRPAIDTDKLPKLVTHFIDYAWALTFSVSVYILIGNVQELDLAALAIALTLIMAFCYLYRNGRLQHINATESSIRKACGVLEGRSVGP